MSSQLEQLPGLAAEAGTYHVAPALSAGLAWKPLATHPVTLAVATLSALLGIWWLTSALQWVPELLLPAPSTVFDTLLKLVDQGYMDVPLATHLGASLLRIAEALGLAMLTAIPAGLIIGISRVGRGILDPIIELYRPVPPLAYLPLMIIWFGIGELSKVLLIYLAIFAPLAIATASGVSQVAESRRQAALSLGATHWQVLRYVTLPSALPNILTGIRIALGIGWSTLVAAELIAATEGIGFMVYAASKFMITDVVIVGILIIAVVALAIELGLRRLQASITPWQNQL